MVGFFLEELVHVAAHGPQVAARPVDAPAARATVKLGLGPQHVRGHAVGNLRQGDRLQGVVAHSTAGECRVRWWAEGLPYLAHLLLNLLRLDEQRAQATAGSQFVVTSEQYRALSAGAAGQFGIGRGVVVGGVVPQQAQPSGQAAQHAVGQEFEGSE